jgi:hypothetical protein
MAAGATYEPIATQTLTSAAASITFSSIAATYTDLRVVFVCQGATAGVSGYLEYNGISTTTYSETYLEGNGTTATSGAVTSNNNIDLRQGTAFSNLQPAMVTIDIFSYAGSTFKTCLIQTSQDYNGSGATVATVGLWRATSAITQVKLSGSGNFAIGTTATLYGIKSA